MSRAHRPHVVIIGGFLTEPRMYAPMRDRLFAAGAGRVTIAPIHLPDWAALVFGTMGPLALRGTRAIREARRAAPDPLIVVGHSLGGLVARLATCPVPLDGRRTGVADDVACLVTLGTPHRLEPRVPWRHAAVAAAEHLRRHCPGAAFAPRTSYLTVGSTFARPAERGPLRSPVQAAGRLLRALVGETDGAAGDGLVDSVRCQLEGAPHIALDDALHGIQPGPWYGDPEVIERWWPAALAGWRHALEARGPRPAAAPARWRAASATPPT